MKTKEECEQIKECNVTNPTCTQDDCGDAKSIVFCDPESGCQGPVTKGECALNPHCDPEKSGCNPNECKAPSWYACDSKTYQCKEGTGKPPAGTIYFNTTKECQKACVSHDVSGVWRGLRVDSGFEADEWDFKFTEADAGASVVFKSNKAGTVYTGTYAIGAALSEEPFGAFELVITLTNGDVLKGLFSVSNSGEQAGPYTRFMYLGLPSKGSDVAISFDDAMAASKQEFVLIACLNSQAKCDFSSATPSRLAF